MPNPHRRHDQLRITVPVGTRDCYRQVARLAGKPLHTWYREALRKVACEVLEQHGVELELPPIHLPGPKRFQPRIEAPPLEEEDP